jgi:hypothetical protein
MKKPDFRRISEIISLILRQIVIFDKIEEIFAFISGA